MYKRMLTMGMLCYLFVAGTARATTWYVPGDYPTIQAAINATVDGDEVIVSSGTYEESLAIKNKYLTLRSVDGPSMTAIWGKMPGTVIDVQGNWGSPATIIDGFEITSKWGSYEASGITCQSCSMKVVNCLVHGCDEHGIECYEAYSDILNTIVVDNHGFADGAGIYGKSADFYITNSTIANNVNENGGAGVYLDDSIYLTNIRNSVIWDNVSQYTTSGHQIWLKNMAALVISYTDLQGGSAEVYVELYSLLSWGSGMIDSDPLFVDSSSGDFHLTYTSPCKDTGDSSVIPELEDFEGDPRIAYGTVDMGADEFYTHLYCTGDFTPGGSMEGKLVGLPGTSPVGLFVGSGELDPPIPTAWGDFRLLPPWPLIQLVPIPSNGVLVLPATIPATPPAPYDVYMQALIGTNSDSLSNLCVLKVR